MFEDADNPPISEFLTHLAAVKGNDRHKLLELIPQFESQNLFDVGTVHGMTVNDLQSAIPTVVYGTGQLILTHITRYFSTSQ